MLEIYLTILPKPFIINYSSLKHIFSYYCVFLNYIFIVAYHPICASELQVHLIMSVSLSIYMYVPLPLSVNTQIYIYCSGRLGPRECLSSSPRLATPRHWWQLVAAQLLAVAAWQLYHAAEVSLYEFNFRRGCFQDLSPYL